MLLDGVCKSVRSSRSRRRWIGADDRRRARRSHLTRIAAQICATLGLAFRHRPALWLAVPGLFPGLLPLVVAFLLLLRVSPATLAVGTTATIVVQYTSLALFTGQITAFVRRRFTANAASDRTEYDTIMATTLPSTPHRILPSDQDASGRTLGEEEIAAVSAALRSGILTSTKGTFVSALESRFARMMGMKHAYACSSGTAAIHCAIAALDPEPGDEIITTPITDMGALTPILYQGAIPVFADVDPLTCNVTAATIEAKIGDRTKAIVVTHLFGNPCDIDEIVALADRHGIPVIEDCAQAFLASYNGQLRRNRRERSAASACSKANTLRRARAACSSPTTRQLARRIYLFINKAWGYGDPRSRPLLPCAELSHVGARAAASPARSCKSCPTVVARRRMLAELLTQRLTGIEAISPPAFCRGAQHSYWKYCVRTRSRCRRTPSSRSPGLLKEHGIVSAPRYIQKPAFMCEVFQKRKTFGSSGYPFTLARPEALDYRLEAYPGTAAALERVLVVPWNDRYDENDVHTSPTRWPPRPRRWRGSIAREKDPLCHRRRRRDRRRLRSRVPRAAARRNSGRLRRPEASAQEYAARVGAPAYSSLKELIAAGDVDAAVVCTPPASHEAGCLRAAACRQTRSVRKAAGGHRRICTAHDRGLAEQRRDTDHGVEVPLCSRRAARPRDSRRRRDRRPGIRRKRFHVARRHEQSLELGCRCQRRRRSDRQRNARGRHLALLPGTAARHPSRRGPAHAGTRGRRYGPALRAQRSRASWDRRTSRGASTRRSRRSCASTAARARFSSDGRSRAFAATADGVVRLRQRIR